VRYTFPSSLKISRECMDLISRIFVKNAGERITIPEIKEHSWFNKTPVRETEPVTDAQSQQSVEEIKELIEKARSKEESPKEVDDLLNEVMHDDEMA